MFDQITCYAPQNRKFIGNATMPLPQGIIFNRNTCPFSVVRNGTVLPTYWELVARYPAGGASVVELIWEDEGVTTESVVYDVVDRVGENPAPTTQLSSLAMNAMATVGNVTLELIEQDGAVNSVSISALPNQWIFTKVSPLWMQGERHVTLPCGISAHVFSWIKSDKPHVYLDLNMHAGNYAAQVPNVYLTSLKLKQNGGGKFTKVIPDGQILNTDDLITPGQHFWPQTQQREWRLILHPPGVNPNEEMLGLGFAHGWHRTDRAGYLAQQIQAPKMEWAQPGLLTAIKRLKGERFQRLANRQPGNPDYQTGTLGFWPVTGVSYGGMTSGVDIEQMPGCDTLAAKHPDGILVHMSESLRYGVRQPGQIYESDGSPVKVELHTDTAGNIAWRHFNYVFAAKRPFEITDPQDTHWDTPFNLDLARAHTKPGTCPYEATLRQFEPIDYQHTTRATKDYIVLAWLANDSIAKLRLKALAENARLTMWEKANGALDDASNSVKANQFKGSGIGRADAWIIDCAAQAYAMGGNAWRTRWTLWFNKYAEYLFYSQTPSGLFQAFSNGKQAEGETNAHRETLPCPFGIHQIGVDQNHYLADFRVGVCNEHFFLMNALRSIIKSVNPTAVSLTGVLERAANCTYDYIWKHDANGPWFRYMGAIVGQQPFANRQALIDAVAVVPDFWTRLDTRVTPPTPFLYVDGYHVGSSIGYGMGTNAHGDAPLNSHMGVDSAEHAFEEIKEYYNEEVAKVVNATEQNLSYALQDFKYAELESKAYLIGLLETRFPG